MLTLVILLGIGVIAWLSITEYKPADVEEAEVTGKVDGFLRPGDDIKVVSWNIGYGALGDNADFFMDGGKGVKTADGARLAENLTSITEYLKQSNADLILLQETDLNSDRSEHTNEAQMLYNNLDRYEYTFGCNFRVPYIPYPMPPIGKVDSGIQTLSRAHIDSAERISLPCPFSWPVRIANLKRCLVVNRIPLDKSDKELVIINLHLEAYDDGEGKAAQTEQLIRLLEEESGTGDYIIAGGDFNQAFSNVDTSDYPHYDGMWECGLIDTSPYEDDWQFVMDNSVPSCRSLDKPYADADHDSFQYYLIDGFIVSRNIRIDSLETDDLGFKASDHNPVVLEATLLK